MQQRYAVSERRGCQITGSHRSVHRYESIRPSQDALRFRIRELARSRSRESGENDVARLAFGFTRQEQIVLIIREMPGMVSESLNPCIFRGKLAKSLIKKMVGPPGLEPGTKGL